MTEMQELLARADVKVEDTWHLEAIFPTDEAWETEFQAVKELIPRMSQFQGKLGESPEQLLTALQHQDALSERLGKLYTYAHMRYDQDTTNSFYQSLDDRAGTLLTQAMSAMSYLVPEILAMDEAVLERFVAENKELQVYQHALEEINLQRPHVLTADKEAMLAQVSDVTSASANTFGMLSNADMKFPTMKDEKGQDVEITHGRFIQLLESDNREVRKSAFSGVYETYAKYKNTFASTLSGAVKRDNFYATVRNYDNARQAALSGNNIPESVYDQLVETVNDNLDLLHRYTALRKKVLGAEALHMYDMYAPLVAEAKIQVTYEEAKEKVVEGLASLGEEYSDIVRKSFDERWIDVYENKGKRSGAYSSGAYGTKPYILMNWQDDVNNLFTLAHELGHSVHSYYTRESQPYVYGNYSIFVAEVAATCNEALLNHYLLENTTDKKERMYLLNNYLETFRGTVFRQTMFAEFEHMIHVKAQEGESLTADALTEMYYALNKKYFGEDVVIDEEIGLEWARIPHFYYNYYVFQYATGFSAATALSKQILEEGQPAIDRYINAFLRAGSSDYPIEVLKKAGVDMTSKKPIEEAMEVFKHYLDELENLLT